MFFLRYKNKPFFIMLEHYEIGFLELPLFVQQVKKNLKLTKLLKKITKN